MSADTRLKALREKTSGSNDNFDNRIAALRSTPAATAGNMVDLLPKPEGNGYVSVADLNRQSNGSGTGVSLAGARGTFRNNYGYGNLDLTDRPIYVNPDGSYSTVRSLSVGFDDDTVLIPTVGWDANRNPVSWTEDEAIQHYLQTGEHLGKFATVEAADQYGQWLHNQQEAYYNNNPTVVALRDRQKNGKSTVAPGTPGGGGRGTTPANQTFFGPVGQFFKELPTLVGEGVQVAAQNRANMATDDIVDPLEAAGIGTFRAMGALPVGEAATQGIAAISGDEKLKANADNVSAGIANMYQQAQAQNPAAYQAGNILGTIMLMSGISQGMGAVPGYEKLPSLAKGIIGGAGSFGASSAVQNAGDVAAGRMTPGEYAKNVGVGTLSGAAGGAAGYGVGALGGHVLTKLGLTQNTLARAVTAGISGAGYAGGRIGVNELAKYLEYPEGYKPDGAQIAQDLLVAFAFSTLSYIASAGPGPQQAAQEKYSSKYFNENMTEEEAQRVYRDLAKQFHPDLHPGDADAAATMAQVNADYEALQRIFAIRHVNAAAEAYKTATTTTGPSAQAAADKYAGELMYLREAAGNGALVGTEAADAVQILSAAQIGAAATAVNAPAPGVNAPATSQTSNPYQEALDAAGGKLPQYQPVERPVDAQRAQVGAEIAQRVTAQQNAPAEQSANNVPVAARSSATAEEGGFTGESGQRYTAQQAAALAAIPHDGIVNAGDFAPDRPITASMLGMSKDSPEWQALEKAGLVWEDEGTAVAPAIFDERARRGESESHQVTVFANRGGVPQTSDAKTAPAETPANALPLEQRVAGDALYDAQDLIDTVRDVGAEVDDNGYITVYHRTSPENADKIRQTGVMKAKEDGVFFSTKENGQNEGYGSAVVALRIPAEKLELDDIFDDEAHVKIPLGRQRQVNVAEYLVKPENAVYNAGNEPKEVMTNGGEGERLAGARGLRYEPVGTGEQGQGIPGGAETNRGRNAEGGIAPQTQRSESNQRSRQKENGGNQLDSERARPVAKDTEAGNVTHGEEVGPEYFGLKSTGSDNKVRLLGTGTTKHIENAKLIGGNTPIDFFGGGNLGTTQDGEIEAVYNPRTGRHGIRYDHPYITADRYAGHEKAHELIDNGSVDVYAAFASAGQELTRAHLENAVGIYEYLYPHKTTDQLLHELVCDAGGNINRLTVYGQKPNEFSDQLDDVLSAIHNYLNDTTDDAFVRVPGLHDDNIPDIHDTQTYETNGGKPAPKDIDPSFADAETSVAPPYRPGTEALREFIDGLNKEARKTFDIFDTIHTIGWQNKVALAPGKNPVDLTQQYMTASKWNDLLKANKEAAGVAKELAAALPEKIRANAHVMADGTIRETPFEQEFRMERAFVQRVVDALPMETLPSTITSDGKEIRISNKDKVISVGGDAYRRALVEERREMYRKGKLPTKSIGGLSKDSWGAMGFLATNGKTGASGDFTTLCPQMYFNKGCFYCYRRAALTTGVNNKLAGETVWYTGEVLQLTQDDIDNLNENGGLRIQSFGDWMEQYSAQLADLLQDAETVGLQIKIITKEPSMIDTVALLKEQGLGKNLYFNLSADYTIEEQGKINNQSGTEAQPRNPMRPYMHMDNGKTYWKRALTVEEANEYRTKYPWVNTRIVATTVDEFLEGLRSPVVDVVTGYHGNIRRFERVSSATGETLLEVEPLGDAGMPRFAFNEKTGKWTMEYEGKTATHKRLAKAIEDAGLQFQYYIKSCCITGRCATCKGKCGKLAKDFYVKNATNADKKSVAYWQKHMTSAEDNPLLLDQMEDAQAKALLDAELARSDVEDSGDSVEYSLTPVNPVLPSDGSWKRGATFAEVKAKHPTLFELEADEAEVRNPTQITGTVKTYRKIYDILKDEGFEGKILDASSGLGVGTEAGRSEYGFNVDDIEPFPDAKYKPKYTDYSNLNKKYDVIISNAVLNVIPQDLRDAMVVKIGQLLAPGGRAFINVRGTDVKNASSKIPINEDGMEYFISDSGSYQKGFRKPELVSYLQDALGDGFTVEPTSQFGGVAAIVTKDGGQKDIRYSTAPSIARLEEENERLRQRLAEARAETKVTKGWRADPKDVAAAAKTIAESASSTYSQPMLQSRLTKLVEEASNGEISEDEVMATAGSIARDVVEKSSVLASKDLTSYNAAKDYLKRVYIEVPDALRDRFDDFKSFAQTHKEMRMKTEGVPIADVYAELQRDLGKEYFPDMSRAMDMLQQIGDVMNSLAPVYGNQYSFAMQMVIEEMSNEVLTAAMDIGQKITYADKAAAKLSEAKAENKATTEKLKTAESYIRSLQRIATRRAEQNEALKQHYADSQKRKREVRDLRQSQDKLMRVLKRLNNRKLPMATKQEILDAQNAVAGVVDTVQKYFTGELKQKRWTEQGITDVGQLEEFIRRKTVEGLDPDMYDPNFIVDGATKRILDRYKMTSVKDMTATQLKELTQALLNIEAKIAADKKFVNSQLAMDFYQAGEEVMGDIASAKPGTIQRKLRPSSAILRMVDWNEDNPLFVAYKEMLYGEEEAYGYVIEALKPFKELLSDHKWLKTMSGKDAKAIKITGRNIDGNPVTVEITPMMRIDLYLNSLNDDNFRDLYESGGGGMIPDMTYYRKGDMTKAMSNAKRVFFTRPVLQNLINDMDDREKAYVKLLQQYYNHFAPDHMNPVSMALDGWEKFTTENYYPIARDSDFLTQDYEQMMYAADPSLAQPGWGEERTHSVGPIYIMDANARFMRMLQGNSMYACQAIPLHNMNRLLGVKLIGQRDTVISALNRQFPDKSAKNYIEKFMSDYAGHRGGRKNPVDKAMDKLRSNYTQGVLALSFNTAAIQFASYPTAAAVVSPAALLQALTPAKADTSFIDKYTTVFTKRTEGFSMLELAEARNEGKYTPKILNPIQAVDVGTTSLLKRAAYFEVRNTRKDLEPGTKAFEQAVVNVYSNIIWQTQPNYSTALRPEVLRSDSSMERAMIMLATQPLQQYNIMYDAIGRYESAIRHYKTDKTPQNKAKVKQAQKGVARAAGVLLASSLLLAILRLGVDVALGNYEKKYKAQDENDTDLAAFARQFGMNMVGGITGMWPIGKSGVEFLMAITDIISTGFGGRTIFGKKWYGYELSTISALSDATKDLINAVYYVVRAANGKSETKTAVKKVITAAEDICLLLGIPAQRIHTYVKAIGHWAGVEEDELYDLIK